MANIPADNPDQSDLTYSLFLGCVIPNRYPMIELATRKILPQLGILVKEMEGASCCPAPGVFRSVDKALWLSIGARNIHIAEENRSDIISLCNGCYGTLLEVNHELKENPELKSRVNEILNKADLHYDGSIEVHHLMEALYYKVGVKKIKSLVKKPLDLRVAVHYGCHLLKPSATKPFGKDVDNPSFFDEIVESLGCESVNYRNKMMCCGAGGALRTGFKENSIQFTLEKLRGIRQAGADCIVVCCPFCQLQMDLGQLEVKNLLEANEPPYNIPVLYITQLIGLAMGYSPQEMGMIKPAGMTGISPFISLDPVITKLFPSKSSDSIEKSKEESH